MKLFNKSKETFGHPIIPLIWETVDPEKIDKSKYICMDLKIRATGANSSTYKKYIKKFEEGTPQEFIDLLKSLEEIWAQKLCDRSTRQKLHCQIYPDGRNPCEL